MSRGFHLHRYKVVDVWQTVDYRSPPLVTIVKRCACGKYRHRYMPGTLPNPTEETTLPRVLP